MSCRSYLRVMVLVVSLGLVFPAAAEEICFPSAKKTSHDAQTIRLKAKDMGWTVSKTSSLSLATIIKGKVELYPQAVVEICLREESKELQIRIQAQSEDAKKAKWRKVIAKREKQ